MAPRDVGGDGGMRCPGHVFVESRIVSGASVGAGSFDPGGAEGHPTELRQQSVETEPHSVEPGQLPGDMGNKAVEFTVDLAAA